MTFVKKYMMLFVGGGIAAVMIIVASVLLVRYLAGYTRVQSELQASQRQLERLHQRSPFPSQENVQRVVSNLGELEHYLEGMLDSLARNQPMPDPMERAAFPAEIERVTRRLRNEAAEAEVKVAETVAFGFERYARGNLPMQEHVPRLVVQLRTIEALCQILFQSKVSELVSVQREVFDVERTQVPAADAPGRRGVRQPSEVVAAPTVAVEPEGVKGLYTRERYTLTFMATDPALRAVLNRMASAPMLMVVRNLELRNEMAVGGAPAQRLSERLRPRGEAQRPTGERERDARRPQAAEERVVAGLERIRVVMELDVYRFERTVEVDQ